MFIHRTVSIIGAVFFVLQCARMTAILEMLQEKNSIGSELTLKGVRFYRSDRRMEVTLAAPSILTYSDYMHLLQGLKQWSGIPVRLIIEAASNAISDFELQKYIGAWCASHGRFQFLADATVSYKANETHLTFRFASQQLIASSAEAFDALTPFLSDIGLPGVSMHGELLAQDGVKVETVKASAAAMAAAEPAPSSSAHPFNKANGSNGGGDYPRRKYAGRKAEDYTPVELKNVQDPIDNVRFEATVFALETIETKTGRHIQTLSLYDGTSAILAKRFEGKRCTIEEMGEVSEGDRVAVTGSISMDTYAKDLVLLIDHLDKLPAVSVTDPSREKRIELHMHTNMSEMDGICEPEKVVKYAWNLGMPGICITDHCDVQSFVKAYNTAAKLKKSDPERKFQVGFGCEMNMADSRLCIVRNPVDTLLSEGEYIAFDLETTGLSAYYDSIIEFGGARIRNGEVVETKQFFVKPPHPIPPYITLKTNISNEMVAQAQTFPEAVDELLAWLGDAVLVAHNATFDYNFLNEELRRIGRPKLKNCTIDTLDMARALMPDRRAYRLGNIARYYRVAYDEESAHRANYDAECLALVFLCLLRDAGRKGAKTVSDLQYSLQNDQAYKKVRRSHVIVMARNREGMKRLYQLVSQSMTKTLAVMGKTSKDGGEITAEPRVLRCEIEKDRRNLLIGTSCLNNEVFELACNGDDERLMKAMMFYDYVEVQPLSNYGTYIAMGNLPSVDRLKSVLRRMITMARRLGIPVVADSDAHYCSKDQKIFRDVYIMNQGVGGAAHPLYIRDDALRMRTKNPDQHIRFGDEMVEDFAWLNDPALVHEIVFENPEKIMAMLDPKTRPVPSGTFPPSLEDSAQHLRDICYRTEHAMYEFEGKVPDIVHNRLEEELENIIRNGFDVHYYIAHLLVKKSNMDGYVVGSRGSVGSSFTATMSGITEVNALPPHYLCPSCHYSEFFDDPKIKSGFDLPDKVCPKCSATMKGNGHNIPFQTFLGFNADKVPDIDLNFSNEYQWRAHAFIKEVFGDRHAFRAGTIGTVAEKTAYGYVSGYCEKLEISDMRRPMRDYLAKNCQNVKRTTGQHPGGIIIIPDGYEAEDFTPVQYPANDPSADWLTTHYDFHDIHDNVLKFDILGHVDPTAMRLLQRVADRKPMTLPMNDPETLSLFYCDDALKADPRVYKKETGALGLPEFGTRTTRRVLEETRPHHFSELVMISGLSHGTDVWAGNAEALVQAGHPLSETIACRDDIMTYLLEKKLEPINAFHIMEHVRKGKGLTEEEEADMRAHDVPDWYIDSCKKIKYMFPKAHAVAYVMMAVRIAWYKVHEPWNFYIQYFSLRCDAYELETMTKGLAAVRARMSDISMRMERGAANPASAKEKSLYDTLEVCEELYARGYSIAPVDLYKSEATVFRVVKPDTKTIIPPFTAIDGLGASVAQSVIEAREQGPFLSKEDLRKRTKLSDTHIHKLEAMGCLQGLDETNQISLF